MKIGAAFADHVKTERVHRKHHDGDSPIPPRSFILILLLFICSVILLLKLINVQIVHGSYYRALADTNRTRTNILYPQRGILFDRNGTSLVYNTPGFQESEGNDKEEISREKAIELLSKNKTLLDIASLRYYPLKEAAAHVLGYVGQISKEELSLPEYGSYTGQDIIGKSGLERYYDKLLRGTKGKELIEVDAVGRKVRTLGQTDPIPGQDITLTLDVKLQETAYAALPGDKKGVVIVSTPTGEILAMVSKPSYDANLFTMGETYVATGSAYQQVTDVLSDNENQPLMDRAIAGVYPPGSTFKLITAAAGLENKIIDESYQVEDTGILKVGTFSFGNWFYLEQGKTEGNVNVVKAITRSNDIFFYKLAEKVSVDKMSAMGAKFGVGSILGIDLPGEAKGTLPTREWKKKVIKEPWYLGDTYHYGIGQGYVLTTPLQVNMWTAAIANGGILPRPHLLKNWKLEIGNSKFLSDETIRLIRQGMIGSCEPGGVAWPLFKLKVKSAPLRQGFEGQEKLKIDGRNFLAVTESSGSAKLSDYREIVVACKTGTAQYGDEDTEPHAWITLFAPAYNPQVVVTVLVESGGQGSNVAAPVAKKVLEEWFGR